MTNEILNLKNAVQKILGSHCLGFVDQASSAGQVAFLTDEDDKGENVPGQWVDDIQKAIRDVGLEHAPVMPFPVKGKLIYVIAGLRRYA